MKYDTKIFAPAHFVQLILSKVQLTVCQQNTCHQTSSGDQEVYAYYVKTQFNQLPNRFSLFYTTSSTFRRCLGIVLQLVVIPKVEWATVYVGFQRRGFAKEMGRGKEVTGTVDYQVHGFPRHFKDHCFVTEGVCYRSKRCCNF